MRSFLAIFLRQSFFLLLIQSLLGIGAILLITDRIESARRESVIQIVTTMPEQLEAELALHLQTENRDAVDFLLYEVLLKQGRSYVRLVKRSDIKQELEAKGYVNCKFTLEEGRGFCVHSNDVNVMGYALLDDSNILIQEARLARIPVSFSSLLMLLAAILVISFTGNFLGYGLFFKRVVHRELQRVLHRIEGQVDGQSRSPARSKSSVEEFYRIEVALHESHERRVAAEQVAIEASKASAIADLVQMMVHDIRRPFSQLSTFLNLVRGSKSFAEARSQIDEFSPHVQASLSSVDAMLKDVLEYGRPDSIEMEFLSLKNVIDRTLVEISPYANERDINITFNLKHLHMAHVDGHKIQRVLTNMMANALQNMVDSGTIKLNSVEHQGRIEISVHNTGTFIPESERSSIFDAFYSLRRRKGTGLGLAIAKKIVQEHGGTISCESDLELGTTFRFDVPAGENTDPYSPIVVTQPLSSLGITFEHKHQMESEEIQTLSQEILQFVKSSGEPFRILLADDDQVYIEGLVQSLRHLSNDEPSIKIETYSTPGETLERARKTSFDLMILDVDYKEEMNGFDLTENLRSNGVESTICLLSNLGAIENQYHALTVGADVFLPKPISSLHLAKLIRSCLNV